MIVISGSSSHTLGKNLAQELCTKHIQAHTHRWPDDECYTRIPENIDGESIILIQNTYPDRNTIELLLLVDAIREYKIKSLTLVIPYFAYARQDKKFNDGEAISARAMAKHIQMGVDRLITVDIHDKITLQWFDIPVVNVSGMCQIGYYYLKNKADVFIAPDDGALERVHVVSAVTKMPWDYMEKKRVNGHTVEVKLKKMKVKGKKVILIDDIISTGGTIVAVAEMLRKQGAKSIGAACIHGLFVSNAIAKLRKVCDNIISSDTFENETTAFSVAPEIAKVLK